MLFMRYGASVHLAYRCGRRSWDVNCKSVLGGFFFIRCLIFDCAFCFRHGFSVHLTVCCGNREEVMACYDLQVGVWWEFVRCLIFDCAAVFDICHIDAHLTQRECFLA